MADARFLNFIDMINGGGAGRAGSRFEGGGLLSMLGNALGIRPYGYEDRLSEMRPMARPAGLLSTQGQTRPQARPLPMTGMDETLVAPQYGMPPEQGPFFKDPRVASPASAQVMLPLERFGGQAPNSGPIGGPGRSPTGGPRDDTDAARAIFKKQFNDIYAIPGMDAYADQMRIDPSVIERAFNRWVANGGRF
jgi:hypothetical protein